MYLRTTQRKNRDGSKVKYYQLANNVWDPEKKHAVAEVVYNFGRADQLDRKELVRLCKSIARICELIVEDPFANDEELPQKGGRPRLPKDLSFIGTGNLGIVWVGQALWKRLGISSKLKELACKHNASECHEKALLAMVVNRLDKPTSKLGVLLRWLKTVYLPECQTLTKDRMYEAMDFLKDHAEEVEKAVFFNTANIFNLEVDLIFYDTTTCSFSIDYEDEEDSDGIRRRGYGKEGLWTPQVVVALAVTREGIPVRSWVFPGNRTDVTTVEEVKRDLRGWKLGRALFVGDCGMNSQENRAELARGCGKYILAVPVSSIQEVKKEVLTRPGRFRKIEDNLYVKEIIVGDGERRRRYMLCFNPREAKRQAKHRAEILQILKEELNKHRDNDATRKWAMELLTSCRYRKYLRKTDDNRILLDTKAIKQAKKLDGKWVLITNDDTISIEDAACAYKSMIVIEQCFRSLKKTQIQLGPMLHRLRDRIEAHVKICVLSLLIQRVAELETDRTWKQLHTILNGLQVGEFQNPTHVFFQRNQIGKEVKEVFNKLEIATPKLVLDAHKI